MNIALYESHAMQVRPSPAHASEVPEAIVNVDDADKIHAGFSPANAMCGLVLIAFGNDMIVSVTQFEAIQPDHRLCRECKEITA